MAVPSLLLGFGGTGAHILSYLKEISVFKQEEGTSGMRFLLFDTIADWKPGETVKIAGGAGEEVLAGKNQEKGSKLDPSTEYFYLKDDYPYLESYVNSILSPGSAQADQYPHLKHWLHASWLSRWIRPDRLNIKDGAAQQRQIGRFATFQNAKHIVKTLSKLLKELKKESNGATINVWLVGSAAGGTGAGSLLDGAFLTHLAAKEAKLAGKVKVTGLIVFPDIYADKEGISNARAYSMFRELNRFQEVGGSTKYYLKKTQISSDIHYEKTNNLHASIPQTLFSSLFYVGLPCHNDGERTDFFMSVANALDPYMDEGQGKKMLEAAVNKSDFAASSFGAVRVYVPEKTFAELFAWQEVKNFLQLMCTPKEEHGQVTDVYSGHTDDRKTEADKIVRGLLPLFDELLELRGKTNEELLKFAKSSLSPSIIVSRWYQFGAGGMLGSDITPAELQTINLTYVNPYFSLRETDAGKVSPEDYLLKTCEESKSAGLKEDKKESQVRFANELQDKTRKYLSDSGQAQTFGKGAGLIRDKISELIFRKIDELLEASLQKMKHSETDLDYQEKGTPFTRTYQELVWITSEHGPLMEIMATLDTFIDSLKEQEGQMEHRVVKASERLKNTKSGWFDWISEPQSIAREEGTGYIRWYQKVQLLHDMKNLIGDVRNHFQSWQRAFNNALNELVLSSVETDSLLDEVNSNIDRLEERLARLSQNRTGLISLEESAGDVKMQGYRDVLYQLAVREGNDRLSVKTITDCQWKYTVERGKPQLILSPFGRIKNARVDLKQQLFSSFKKVTTKSIEKRDIFDYLMYLSEEKGISVDEIARIINGVSADVHNEHKVLLRTDETPDVFLIYKKPSGEKKNWFATSLHSALKNIGGTDQNIEDAQTLHTDKNALSLLKICSPSSSNVDNMEECQEAYLEEIVSEKSFDDENDQELLRAQVYHPFRAELEAWYIERSHYRKVQESGLQLDDLISPRLVKLLDYPERMQSFVRCIATKAIYKDKNQKIWVFDSPSGEIHLTRDDEPKAGLVKAAITFVLRQCDARTNRSTPINVDDAEEIAVRNSQNAKQNVDDQVESFTGKVGDSGSDVRAFIDSNFDSSGMHDDVAEKEKEDLVKIFQFYGDSDRRSYLADRFDLPN